MRREADRTTRAHGERPTWPPALPSCSAHVNVLITPFHVFHVLPSWKCPRLALIYLLMLPLVSMPTHMQNPKETNMRNPVAIQANFLIRSWDLGRCDMAAGHSTSSCE